MCSLRFEKLGLLVQKSFTPLVQQIRTRIERGYKRGPIQIPKLRHPIWYAPIKRKQYDQGLTAENEAFVREQVHARYGPPAIVGGVATLCQPLSVLKEQPVVHGEWSPGIRRTGLIARKIGVYPMWTKEGKKFFTTLLQIVDNHVIKYIPPEDYHPPRPAPRRRKMEGKFGCLLVGSESADPQLFTKDYCGLFAESGMAPKRNLGRFLVSPEAALQPGTPLLANHFRVGDFVDVAGKTISRGFQGVMKRHGFKGMPASHGVTKTHRRPGNIGGGGEKGRVWPGTKLPGHMGNRLRTVRGMQIVRINTRYNVIFVRGHNVAGNTNTVCRLYDTLLPLRWLKKGPPFPTYFPEGEQPPTEEDQWLETVHSFTEPTITFEPEPPPKKK